MWYRSSTAIAYAAATVETEQATEVELPEVSTAAKEAPSVSPNPAAQVSRPQRISFDRLSRTCSFGALI